MKKRLLSILGILFLISFISAASVGTSDMTEGKVVYTPPVFINYSIISTNTSNYWGSHYYTDYDLLVPYTGATGNVDLGLYNFTTSGTYNNLSIISGDDWIYLSGDGSIEEGFDISIPKYAGRDFYYGYGGGAEDHYFGSAGGLTITSDGNLITAGTGTFGDLVVDTNTFVVDAVNKRIGYGTATPAYDVEFTKDGADMNFYVFSHSNNPALKPNIVAARSRGTRASPNAVVLNDRIGFFGFVGYDGSGYQGGASVEGFCDANPSAGAVPIRLSFLTGSNFATRAERLKINYQGAITMNAPVAGSTLNINRKTGSSSIRATGSTILMLDSSDSGPLYLNYYLAGDVIMAIGGGNVGIGTSAPTHKLNVVGDANITGTIINPAIYCESSELTDQIFPTAGVRYRLNISNIDEGNGISMESGGNNGTNITIDTSGVYHLVAQPQVKAGAGAAGDFHMWLEKFSSGSWTDISDSNIELKLSSLEEDVIVLATTLKLNQGEKLRLVVSVSDNGILLHAQSPAGEPVIPSIIFTMYRIGS